MSKRGNSRRVNPAEVDGLLALSLDELHALGRVAGQKLSQITAEMIAAKTEIANISAAIKAKRNGDDNLFGVSDHAVLRYLERVKGLDVKAVRDEIRAYVQARVEAGRQNQIIDMGDGISAAVTDARTVATVWVEEDE